MALNRRRSARYALNTTCFVKACEWQASVAFDVSEVSLYGVWIEGDLLLDEGQLLMITFHVGSSHFDHLLALVRHVRMHRRCHESGRAGMALDFLDIRPSERDALQIALESACAQPYRHAA